MIVVSDSTPLPYPFRTLDSLGGSIIAILSAEVIDFTSFMF